MALFDNLFNRGGIKSRKGFGTNGTTKANLGAVSRVNNNVPSADIIAKIIAEQLVKLNQSVDYNYDADAIIQQAYKQNSTIYSIIRLLTRTASQIPVYAYEVVDEKAYRRYKAFSRSESPDLIKLEQYRKKALVEVEKHPIYDWLYCPNPGQTWSEFTENAIGYKFLNGNTYIHGKSPETGSNKGKIIQTYVLPSQFTEIVIGDEFNPIKEYRVKYWYDGEGEVIPKEEILHLKYWSPDYSTPGNHYYGISPVRAGMRKVRLDNDGVTTMIKMFQNMGLVGVFNVNNDSLDEQQLRVLEKKFYQKFGTPNNAGKAMFTNGNWQWEQAGMSPVDLGILTAMNYTLREQCNLFNLSSQLMNDPDNKTYNNMKEARKAMYTNAILPDFHGYLDGLNNFVTPSYNDKSGKVILDYDIQAIPELQEDMEKLVKVLSESYWLTGLEKREMMNYGEPKDNDQREFLNQFFVPGTLLPSNVSSLVPDGQQSDGIYNDNGLGDDDT